MKRCGVIVALLLVAAFTTPRAAHAQALVADLSSHLVAITTGFTGTEVLLFGAVEGPGDVVVVVRGPDEHIIVRHKRRVLGIFINRESMSFAKVPSFYQVAASRELDKIVPPAERARQEIGIDALRLVPDSQRDPVTVSRYRDALFRNKEVAGLYGRTIAKVISLGARLFRVNFYFPSNVPIGTYQVQVFLFRNGEVVAAQTTPLVVSKIGTSAEIFEFAHRQAFAYGVLAILLALMAGWLASVVFRRGAA